MLKFGTESFDTSLCSSGLHLDSAHVQKKGKEDNEIRFVDIYIARDTTMCWASAIKIWVADVSSLST
jgi:hypothetical protein